MNPSTADFRTDSVEFDESDESFLTTANQNTADVSTSHAQPITAQNGHQQAPPSSAELTNDTASLAYLGVVDQTTSDG